jgi:polar amino acid transport system substrate-binding protein
MKSITSIRLFLFALLSLTWLFSSDGIASQTAQQPGGHEVNTQELGLQNADSLKNLNAGQIALLLQTQAIAPDILCIQQTGVLRVAIVDENNPPFHFTNKKGELDGIDIEIAKKIASEFGVKAEFIKAKTYDEVVDLIVSKKAHLGISKLSVTSLRAQKVRFAGSYAKFAKGLLINRVQFNKLKSDENNTIEEIFKLPGVSIGVIAKTSYEQYAKTMFPNTALKTYTTWDEVINALLKGEILAAFRDEWEIRKTLYNNKDLGIYAEAIYLKSEDDPIQIILPWNSNQLASFVDMFLKLNAKYQYTVPQLYELYKKYEAENKK